MTEQALNQLTRRIVLDAARLEYGGLLEGAPEHTFSPAFEREAGTRFCIGRCVRQPAFCWYCCSAGARCW